MLDLDQTRCVPTSGFGYRDEVAGDGRKVAFDVGAAFFRDVTDAGLRYTEMPAEFATAYRHYGGMTWQRVGDKSMPGTRRLKQGAKSLVIRARLQRSRRLKPPAAQPAS